MVETLAVSNFQPDLQQQLLTHVLRVSGKLLDKLVSTMFMVVTNVHVRNTGRNYTAALALSM